MAARAGRHGDDSVDAHLRAFARVPVAGDVVEDEAAISVNRRDDLRIRSQSEHDDGRAMFDDHGEIVCEPRIGAMADEIDGVGRGAAGELVPDAREILVELHRRARIERGHGADDSGAALRDEQRRRGGDEHRAGHDGQREPGAQPRGELRIAAHAISRNVTKP